jgi:5-methylcytosine-specific restriction endonuclease McrBC regulatory subunit McrC
MAEIAAEARPSSPQFSQAQQGLADRYAAYRPALRLARSLLIGGGPISTARGDGMIGWGLNMAELFERAVYKGISRWCQRNNLLAKWQAVERKLIRDAEGAKYRNLRPDIEVRKNGRLLAIVDAKYKGYLSTSEDGSTPLEKVQNADIYQLAFYGQIPSSADEPAKRPQLFIASPSMETASLPNRYKSLLVAERRLELLEVDLERLPEVGEIPIPGMIAAPKAYEGMDEKQPN